MTVNAFDDVVTIEQIEPHTDRLMRITLSPAQVADLAAALDLPEGAYEIRRKR